MTTELPPIKQRLLFQRPDGLRQNMAVRGHAWENVAGPLSHFQEWAGKVGDMPAPLRVETSLFLNRAFWSMTDRLLEPDRQDRAYPPVSPSVQGR